MTDPFVYQPPNERTIPRYAAIRSAADEALAVVRRAGDVERPTYAEINDACRGLHDTISSWCPSSADTSAALRCARIARMAANEAVTVRDPEQIDRCLRLAIDHVLLARWQACAAVALGDSP